MKLSAWLFLLLTGAALTASCSSAPAKTARSRIPLTDLRPGPNSYYYRGKLWTKQKYDRLKEGELQRFRMNLPYMYALEFRYRHSGYFNIADRCSEREIKHLLKSILKFQERVYPEFFLYEPDQPIRIIVFKNRREFIARTGTRVYGSYIPGINTMLTYCGSGSGTMRHELIHAFVKLNSAMTPQEWFNEGFASFFEKGRIHNGRFIAGFTNWRLRRLQAALAAGPVPALESLMVSKSLTDRRVPLARSRFLFCYLWSHGKMRAFTQIYLYELMPRYQGVELGRKAVEALESIMGQSIEQINRDYLQLARSLRPNQRIPRRENR